MEEVVLSGEKQVETPGGLPRETVLTLAKGSLIGLVGRLLGRALMLLYQAVLARSLGRELYGLFSLGWSVLQLTLYMGPAGIQQAIVRFASPLWKKDEIGFRRIIQQALILALFSGSLAGGVVFVFSPLFAGFFQKPTLSLVWRGVALAIVLSSVLRALSATIQVSRKVQYSILLEELFLPFVMVLAAALLTVLWHWGLYGALLSVVIGYVLVSGLGWWFVRRLYPSVFRSVNWEIQIFRRLSSFSFPATLIGLLNLLTQWSPRLILGYFRTASEVGLYQAAFQVATLPALILASTGPIFIPVIARLAGEKAFEQVNQVYKVTTKWSLYASFPLILVIFFYPTTVLRFFFGKEYEEAFILVLILLLSQLVNAASGGTLPMHLMLGYERRALQIQSLTFGFTFLLAIWGSHQWGATGTALATAAGISFANLAALISLWQIGKYSPFDRQYWKGGVAAVFSAFSVAISAYLYPDSTNGLVGSLLVSMGVFIGILWRLGFDREEKYFLEALWRRIRLLGGQHDQSA